MTLLLVVLTLVLAAANGANDLSKGISTLFGSGISNYRAAALWGAAWTAAGAIVAAFASQLLVSTFSGNGLLYGGISGASLLLPVAVGALGWLVIATATALPVSTTHSLLGALIGSALVGHGFEGIKWAAVATKVALPLLISPFVSILLVTLLLPLLGRPFRSANRYCLCVEQREPVAITPNGVAMERAVTPSLEITAGADCRSETVVRVNAIDSLHWLSAAATSFLRGVNDTPKILALGLAAATAALTISATSFYLLVAAAMAVGAIVAGFRVTETLAKKVTRVSAENGFAANLVTAMLVGLASLWALPVSTTHVSTGAIVGIGVAEGGKTTCWRMVGEILLAWLVTLPVSGFVAAAVSLAIS